MTTNLQIAPHPHHLLVRRKGTIHKRAVQVTREGEREVVRFDARSQHGLAWWHDVPFDTGTIFFQLRGKNEPQRSFLGIAFNGAFSGLALTAGGEVPDAR